jgi:Protein of unknown function (DUF2889)
MPEPDMPRRGRRTKTLDVFPEAGDTWWFHGALVDESFGGVYEDAAGTVTVHDFSMTGRVTGDDLRLTELDVTAREHPFPQCPFVLPAAGRLIGSSLASGWRRTVLDQYRGAAGCTHVTTLLLGLSEIVTLVFFQRMNEHAAYGPRSRESGEWIAGSAKFAPDLRGACHALSADGPVIRQAELHVRERGTAG